MALDPQDSRDPSHSESDRPASGAPDRQPADAGPLDALFSHVPATIWMTDHSLVVTFIHGRLLHNLQVAPQKIVGRSLQDLLLDGREDHPLIEGHRAALDGHETTVRIEWGGLLYSARIAPLRDATGDVVGCAGVHQQIGWLPDEEGTLRESDIRLRRVIDSNIIGIAFGNAEGQITDANDAFLHLAGYSREDLVADGISWPALTPVEYHQRQLEAFQQIRDTGRCLPFENELIRRDGRRIAVLVGAARVSARRQEGVAFVLDVSAHKALERRLRAELACANLLADADSLADVSPALLERIAEGLGWDYAALWIRQPNGDVGRLATWGRSLCADSSLDAFGRGRGDAVLWVEPARAVVVPLLFGEGNHGSLVLTGDRPGLPEPAVVDTLRAIARRIARRASRP